MSFLLYLVLRLYIRGSSRAPSDSSSAQNFFHSFYGGSQMEISCEALRCLPCPVAAGTEKGCCTGMGKPEGSRYDGCIGG